MSAVAPLHGATGALALRDIINDFLRPIDLWVEQPEDLQDPTLLQDYLADLRHVLRLLDENWYAFPTRLITGCRLLVASTFERAEKRQRWADRAMRQACSQVSRQPNEVKLEPSAGGRPEIVVPPEMLSRLYQAGMTYAQMCDILMISRSTLWRRLKEHGLGVRRDKVKLSDSDVADQIPPTVGVRGVHPYIKGVILVSESGRDQPFLISRDQVMRVMRAIDPHGVAQRFSKAINRRQYYVPFVNSLWHMDGHHKLVRWGVVIHLAIDGLSRRIMFAQAVTNNRAQTVLEGFLGAVQKYGIPSRIRVDRGTENLRVRDYMVSHPARGPGRGSCLRGKSVHNQKVERIWVDLQAWATSQFQIEFHCLERIGLLRINDPVSMWCFHFVYLPVVQRSVANFVRQWNAHGLRTERGLSPYQLYEQGVISAELAGFTVQDGKLNLQDNLVRFSHYWQPELEQDVAGGYGTGGGVDEDDDADAPQYRDRVREDETEDDGTEVVVVEPLGRMSAGDAAALGNAALQSALQAQLGEASWNLAEDRCDQFKTCLNVIESYLRL